jgi:hypothetical protein
VVLDVGPIVAPSFPARVVTRNDGATSLSTAATDTARRPGGRARETMVAQPTRGDVHRLRRGMGGRRALVAGASIATTARRLARAIVDADRAMRDAIGRRARRRRIRNRVMRN